HTRFSRDWSSDVCSSDLDRFMLKCRIDYPSLEDERLIMKMVASSHQPVIRPVISLNTIVEAKNLINQIYLDEKIEKYILDMVFRSEEHTSELQSRENLVC